MSGMLLRDVHSIERKVPSGILLNRRLLTEGRSEHVRPEAPGGETPTYIHPAVVAVAVGGYAWMLLAFWVLFLGDSYMRAALFVATGISALLLGLLIGCGSGARDVTPWQRSWLSFREFLSGEVEVWGGRISGRGAFIQIAGSAACLAALATAFAVIIAVSRP